MKVLLVLASPRKDGNTSRLLKKVGNYLKDHSLEFLWLGSKGVNGCIECFTCQNVMDSSGCSIKDDMQPIYNKLMECDAFILASPVFCWNLSAQAKAFLDRLYCMCKYPEDSPYVAFLRGKKASLVMTSAGNPEEEADLAVDSFKRFCEYNRIDFTGELCVKENIIDDEALEGEIIRFAKNIVT